MNFVSTPWKIKIPLGKSVGDHIWAIYIYIYIYNIYIYIIYIYIYIYIYMCVCVCVCVDDSGGGWVGGGHVGGGRVGMGGGWVIIIFQGVLTKLNLLMKF